MISITLPHNFSPREYQKPFFKYMNNGGKRAVLVWSRRSGKDTSAWNFLIYTAIETKGIYYYIFPTFAQGRKVLWDGMNNEGFKFLDYIPKQLVKATNNQEMKIKLINGSLIQVVGSDNYDAIRGTNPSGCIFSEYAEQDPNVWMVVSPILDSNNGWAVFVFTPKGTNHAKVMFDKAKTNPGWYCSHLTCRDTNSVTEEDIERIRAEGLMSEDMIQQEHFCSFTLGIQGSYYAHYLQKAKDEDRICHVPYQKQKKVCTAWDVGYNDETAIIFFQCIGQEIHIIDYYENRQREAAHYAKVLADRPYLYDKHFAPHDVCAHQKGDGFELRSVYANLSVDFTVLKLDQIKSIVEGIECSRSLFPSCYFDSEKCKMLIQALENYRQQYDKTREYYSNKPVHDKFSNAADSFRYLCIGVRQYMYSDRGPTDDEVERMRDRHNPVFR
jgi:phage terminase large subunit